VRFCTQLETLSVLIFNCRWRGGTGDAGGDVVNARDDQAESHAAARIVEVLGGAHRFILGFW
jgi:hypothetical protein